MVRTAWLLAVVLAASGCEDDEKDDSPTLPGGDGKAEILITYLPAYGSAENLLGQVWHVWPQDHRVAVYIRVSGGWWTKPLWDRPVTGIYPDGSWVCDVTTGGIDEQATAFAAFLVLASYEPPFASGGDIPSEIYPEALAWVEMERPPP